MSNIKSIYSHKCNWNKCELQSGSKNKCRCFPCRSPVSESEAGKLCKTLTGDDAGF